MCGQHEEGNGVLNVRYMTFKVGDLFESYYSVGGVILSEPETVKVRGGELICFYYLDNETGAIGFWARAKKLTRTLEFPG